MGDRKSRIGRAFVALAASAAMGLAAAAATAAEPKIKTLAAGFGYENLTRTIVWTGDTASTRLKADLFTARAEFGFAGGITASLSAGFVLTSPGGLTFANLPVSLQYQGPSLRGVTLGAEAVVPIRKFSDFEISGTGRFVYSFGMSKTWPLEDFAVDGEAEGRSSWAEIAAGPRVSYLFFGRVVPYAEVCLRWLRSGFRMTETLEDLGGTETKRVRGDVSFSVALGADAVVSDRLAVRGKVGILPFAGGVDSLLSLGILYKF